MNPLKSLLLACALLSSLAHAQDYKLKCTVQESLDEDDTSFTMIGKNVDGVITFNENLERLPSYFITLDNPYRSADHHIQARVEFEAQIVGRDLVYNFKYYNYLRERSEGVTVLVDETRKLAIDYDELDDGSYHFFDGSDGEIVSSYINKDDWINWRGYDLEDCEISYLTQEDLEDL